MRIIKLFKHNLITQSKKLKIKEIKNNTSRIKNKNLKMPKSVFYNQRAWLYKAITF